MRSDTVPYKVKPAWPCPPTGANPATTWTPQRNSDNSRTVTLPPDLTGKSLGRGFLPPGRALTTTPPLATTDCGTNTPEMYSYRDVCEPRHLVPSRCTSQVPDPFLSTSASGGAAGAQMGVTRSVQCGKDRLELAGTEQDRTPWSCENLPRLPPHQESSRSSSGYCHLRGPNSTPRRR